MFLLETKCLEKIIASRVLPIVLFCEVDSQSCVKSGEEVEVFDQLRSKLREAHVFQVRSQNIL